jgi:hypothetical protein
MEEISLDELQVVAKFRNSAQVVALKEMRTDSVALLKELTCNLRPHETR